jgi:NAD(P)-dependent dehydrogenase (short-subunit alcohol dehydrogenase family)
VSERAALVTGGSRGIGRELAVMLAEEGYAVTISGRRPEPLAAAVADLRDRGLNVEGTTGDVSREEDVPHSLLSTWSAPTASTCWSTARESGSAPPIEQTATKGLDLMTAVNLRSLVLAYREATPALLAAAEEHGNALVLNLASMAGVAPQPWTSIYSATKAAVRAFTAAMNRELSGRGVKSTALSPSYVDTDMTEYMRDQLPRTQMIATADTAEMARPLLRLSRWCLVPEVQLARPGEAL